MKSVNLHPSPILDTAEYIAWEEAQSGSLSQQDYDEAALAIRAQIERNKGSGDVFTDQVDAADIVAEELSGPKKCLVIVSDMIASVRKLLRLPK